MVRFFGLVCKKHPELNGERYTSSRRCVGCNRDAIKAKRSENPTKGLGYAAKSRQKTKEEVFNHYGGMKCCKCGFDHPDALCLDHIGGGGGKLRKEGAHPWGGYALYVWLKKNGFPAELKFRVLCFNCNAIESVERLRIERKKK